MSTRRDIFRSAMAGALGAVGFAGNSTAAATSLAPQTRTWRRGSENQRLADLGDGTFLNPVLGGDFADPTVLRDGDEFYMTNSSFDASPGIVLWRSRDLVNWSPIGPALFQPIGNVWAMDLVKHAGRFYLYIPAFPGNRSTVMVMHADRIEGPWSSPIDLGIARIDPGHVVGEDGRRYLFVAGGGRVRLTDDGLATDGPLVEGAYELWRYPQDWVVEMYAPEGPKFFWRNGYVYLVGAVGGTAGPPTSHMVVVSRSRSVFGPWEQCPHNPVVRTASAAEPWWSRGHATFIEDPTGQWWTIYHGYENGFRTLGRQVLLEPLRWDEHGWPHALGGDLSRPSAMPAVMSPAGRAAPVERTLSDDFSKDRFGTLWRFHQPAVDELARVKLGNSTLTVRAKGTSPADCSPLTGNAVDRAYECSVALEPRDGAQGGLLLFYSEKAYYGVGFDGRRLSTHVYGELQGWLDIEQISPRLELRITNDHHVVTLHYRAGAGEWKKHPWQWELSGVHQNVLGGFLSLRPALFACGSGAVSFRDFRYRGLS